MNKNNNKMIAFLMIILIIVSTFLFFIKGNDLLNIEKHKVATKDDSKKFKDEYESYNGKKREGKDYVNMTVNLPLDNHMVYTDIKELLHLLKKGTGIIYFGFPTCPWCRNAVPILIEAAKEENVSNIYYFNALSIRDEKHIDEDGNIVVDKEGTKEYKEIVELLKEVLPAYEGLHDDSIKRLYFPTVVFVKDGKIISSHEGTIDSQIDPMIPLTKEQKIELKEIYMKQIQKIYGSVCDKSC